MGRILGLGIGACAAVVFAVAVSAASGGGPPSDVFAYWTAERLAQAEPRDLVRDDRGLSYLRGRGGVLHPYGHETPARVQAAPTADGPTRAARPSAGSDTTPPVISGMDPSAGQTIGSAHTFTAAVTDAESGVRSVLFVIGYPDGRTQGFSASQTAPNTWTVSLSGFWNGNWNWSVEAKDSAPKGGNTTTSGPVSFTVDTSSTGGGGGGGGDSTVANARWTGGGTVQTAAGRIYFEMPANRRQTKWTGYVCSGTTVTDARADASILVTAAHCVYDDVNKAFARNVMFIPDQDGTTGTGTDRNCENDPLGCWAPSYGVVDSDWSSRTWPDNIPWDYAYYVVPVEGAHSGTGVTSSSLEAITGTLAVSFAAPSTGSYTHALGYSYSDDPNFMYCAENMGTSGSSNWWLSQCGLSGGASGGPWLQPVSDGSGPVVSVNSWGYSTSPGMAGPKLSGTSAECLFGAAQNAGPAPTGGGLVPAAC